MSARVRRLFSRAVPVAAALSCVQCAPKFAEVWQLEDFRVLGVKASPAQPDRGTDVMLRLASADPQGRAVQVAWFMCSRAISVLGNADAGAGGSADGGGGSASFGCPPEDLQIGIGTNPTFHVPMTGGSPDSSGRETLTVFAYACAGGTIGAPEDGGTTPTCAANGDGEARGWLFTRSIFVHDPESPQPANQNPTIQNILFGPVAPPPAIALSAPPEAYACREGHACTRYHFQVQFADGAREQYPGPDPITGEIRTYQERLTTGYVVDRGTLAGGFRTDSEVLPESDMDDEWTPPAETGPVTVYVYAADDRGGFDYTRRVINVVDETTPPAQRRGADAGMDAGTDVAGEAGADAGGGMDGAGG